MKETLRQSDQCGRSRQLQTPFDVIIDDGLHTCEANVRFLTGSFEHVRPGGLYVIEDIRAIDLDHWRFYIRDHQRQYPRHEIALVQLLNSTNQFDNNVLIIRPHNGVWSLEGASIRNARSCRP